MTENKAKEYALKRAELYSAGGVKGLDAWMGLELELEKAFRAGHSQGIADANRKVEIHEPPVSFSRGMNG